MASISVGTTAVQILLVDKGGTPQTDDSRLYIQNRGAVEVFFGPTSAVTATSDAANAGIGLGPGSTLEYPSPTVGGGFDIWVIAASGTAEVRWIRT